MDNLPRNRIQFPFLLLLTICLSLVLYLILASKTFNLSPSQFILQFKNSLYFPNKNQFFVGQIEGINTLKIFYGFLFLLIISTVACFAVFIRSPEKQPIGSLARVITITAIAGLLIFSAVQQCHRTDNFVKERNMLSGKTVDEKNSLLFGMKYQFAFACQKVLTNRHQGTLITDFDLTKSPYMFYQRALSYHLYPKVSLRFNNQTPKDIILMFHKKNPLEHLPENYQVLLTTENQEYVLAIEKKNPR